MYGDHDAGAYPDIKMLIDFAIHYCDAQDALAHNWIALIGNTSVSDRSTGLGADIGMCEKLDRAKRIELAKTKMEKVVDHFL